MGCVKCLCRVEGLQETRTTRRALILSSLAHLRAVLKEICSGSVKFYLVPCVAVWLQTSPISFVALEENRK